MATEPLPTVAFDEAGNTGDNLLDEGQPIHCLASVSVPPGAASELVGQVLPDRREELHFADLRRSREGREAILGVLTSGVLTPETSRATPMHKPYAVVARLFDYVLEPTIFERGHDVYDSGAQRIFANVLYRHGPRVCGEERWSQLLTVFVRFTRNQHDETLDEFIGAFRRCQLAATEVEIRRILDLFPQREEVAKRLDIDQPGEVGRRDLLDPGVPALMENVFAWAERLGNFRVVHDHAPLVERWRQLLEQLAGPQAADVVGPYWARRMPLPLAIDGVDVVHSHDTPEVQLADVVAGACVGWLTEQLSPRAWDARFAADLGDTILPKLIENEVWPEPLSPLGRYA